MTSGLSPNTSSATPVGSLTSSYSTAESPELLERAHEQLRVGCTSEREQLHEQPPVGGDQLAVRTSPLLADVDVSGARVGCALADARRARRARAAHVAAFGRWPFA